MATNQNTPIKKIAISTGGGDAPGLNAVIRATALSAIKRVWEVYGVRDGFHGILSPEEYPNGGFIPLTRERISGITHLGGTILGTSNRNNPLKYPVVHPDVRVKVLPGHKWRTLPASSTTLPGTVNACRWLVARRWPCCADS